MQFTGGKMPLLYNFLRKKNIFIGPSEPWSLLKASDKNLQLVMNGNGDHFLVAHSLQINSSTASNGVCFETGRVIALC